MFSSGKLAEAPVAGLPAAARAVREVAAAGIARCQVVMIDGAVPASGTRREAQRLAGAMELDWPGSPEAAAGPPDDRTLLVSGPQLVRAERIQAFLKGGEDRATDLAVGEMPIDREALERLAKPSGAMDYAAQARRIVAETAKPGDGIVSRSINRPISQAISRQLLRFGAIRPIHATIGTALLAMLMLAALLSGTAQGLVAGALLFQTASIFDGVDGEIARATFRSSPQGARLDSLVDAFTNLACVGGVALNLHLQGESGAALAGGAGLALLAMGLALLARQSRAAPGGLTFNALKDHFSARGSATMTALTWLTSRDFFALAGAVLIVGGFATQALIAFAVVAAGWLAVVLAVTMRHSA